MKTIRVLLVDDNPAFSRAATNFLNSQPYMEVVGCATSAAQAMDLVATLKPDLVLMDVVMPGMNGLEATRQLKRAAAAPKIVVVTLHQATAYRLSATAAGADGFVAKDHLVTDLPPLINLLFAGRGQLPDPANDG